MNTKNICTDDEVSVLPGFRFHPTDGELVGFYLRRKVEKKPIRIELIKQIDIYKYDPWDLPKTNSAGEKEGYFFCQRGRKYRNSVRPNRVTGSGFWKATGIDRQVYSMGGEDNECIGLKKTLVYYRGSAGKGTKTDWMMHEFRLPTNSNNTNIAQEAEVWTLCRIFKRIASNKKYTPDWREISTKTISKKCSVELNNREDNYLSFSASNNIHDLIHDERKPVLNHIKERNQLSLIAQQPPSMASSSSFTNMDANGVFTCANWDELRPVVEFAINPFLL